MALQQTIAPGDWRLARIFGFAVAAALMTGLQATPSHAAPCDSSYEMGRSLGRSGTGPGQAMYNNMLRMARQSGCEKAFVDGNGVGFKECTTCSQNPVSSTDRPPMVANPPRLPPLQRPCFEVTPAMVQQATADQRKAYNEFMTAQKTLPPGHPVIELRYRDYADATHILNCARRGR